MARVEVQLPSVFEPIVGEARTVQVEGETLAGALAALVVDRPDLGVHLFDESGGFREHVLCFHNGTNTRWLESLEVPLADGDTLTIMQAVSGG